MSLKLIVRIHCLTIRNGLHKRLSAAFKSIDREWLRCIMAALPCVPRVHLGKNITVTTLDEPERAGSYFPLTRDITYTFITNKLVSKETCNI